MCSDWSITLTGQLPICPWLNGYDENTDKCSGKKMLFPQTTIMANKSTTKNAEISSQLYEKKT